MPDNKQKLADAQVPAIAHFNLTIMQAVNFPEFVPSESTWQMWLERLEVHFTEVAITLDDSKRATLLKSVFSEVYCVLHSLCSPELPTSKTYKELCAMLHTQYTPPTITFYERRQFHLASKLAEESVAAWFARVKKLALSCTFGQHLEAFVLDKFIVGMSNELFERFCEEDGSISLDAALRKALLYETKLATKTCTMEESRTRSDGMVNFVNKTQHSQVAKGKKRQPCSRCG